MNMNSNNLQDLENKFKSLIASKSEDELLKEDEFILMANYLSEIERLQRLEGVKFKRKELASQIKVSASYLTQIFRGDRPLNFKTIAKIQRALNIRFHVRGTLENEIPVYIPYDLHNILASKNIDNLSKKTDLSIMSDKPFEIKPQIKELAKVISLNSLIETNGTTTSLSVSK